MDVNLEQVYRSHKDHLYNYIYRLCNDPDQAQDVVQQTFIKIITDDDLDKVSNIKSYLFTIARNHLYDTWKKKKETLVDDIGLDIAATADEGTLTDELTDQQLQKAVTFCVQRLTDKHREIMLLRYIEDLSIKEISSITQRRESDIKVSLLRARKQFDLGLTQHMYLKVAKSRQQCTEMDTLLAPYTEREIPANELTPFEQHIAKCQICSEDAEEMKRTRKLLAIIPLATAPLALDTSFNDALASSVTSTASGNSSVNSAVLTKVAASIAVVALIATGAVLVPNDKQTKPETTDSMPVAQAQAKKPISAENENEVKSASQNDNIGDVQVRATARLAPSSPPVHVTWVVHKHVEGETKNNKSVYANTGDRLTKALTPGQYRITASSGKARIERIIEVKENKPVSLDFILNAGYAKIYAHLPKTMSLNSGNVTYLLYKSKKDLDKQKTYLARSHHKFETNMLLPDGEYFLKAKYSGIGEISTIKSLKIQAGKTTTVNIPLEFGMFKPMAILSGKNLPHNRNINWEIEKLSVQNIKSRSIHSLKNGKSIATAPGKYLFTAKLGKIEKQTNVTIKDGQLTPINLTMRGGIVKSSAWSNKSLNSRNSNIYLSIYESEQYKNIGKPGVYIPKIASIRNDLSNAYALLPVGKYTLVAKNKIGHKVRATREFEVKDGDTKQIDLEIPFREKK